MKKESVTKELPDGYAPLEEVLEKPVEEHFHAFKLPDRFIAREKHISESEVAVVREAWRFTEKTPGKEVYPPYAAPTLTAINISQYGTAMAYFSDMVLRLVLVAMAALIIYSLVKSWSIGSPAEILRAVIIIGYLAGFLGFYIRNYFAAKAGGRDEEAGLIIMWLISWGFVMTICMY